LSVCWVRLCCYKLPLLQEKVGGWRRCFCSDVRIFCLLTLARQLLAINKIVSLGVLLFIALSQCHFVRGQLFPVVSIKGAHLLANFLSLSQHRSRNEADCCCCAVPRLSHFRKYFVHLFKLFKWRHLIHFMQAHSVELPNLSGNHLQMVEQESLNHLLKLVLALKTTDRRFF
jgi:hypothetical protein